MELLILPNKVNKLNYYIFIIYTYISKYLSLYLNLRS